MRLTLICGLGLLWLHGACTQAPPRPPWSPQTAELLFTSGRDGNAEVYRWRGGASEWINLTNHKAGDNWPVWSPDGKRIAFQSNRSGNLDIWVMNEDGSAPTPLTQDAEPDYLPAWSPDGRTILFTSWRREPGDEKRAPHVYAMNADGTQQRRLVKASLNTSAGATWSPDGRQIVYTRQGEKGADVFIADANGTNERQVTHDDSAGLYNGAPSFSPDGRQLAFYSASSTASALVVLDLQTQQRRTLIAEGQNWYPRWSPDGRWLVYTAAVPGAEKGNIDLFALPVDGRGPPLPLVASPKRDQEGSWRPLVTQ